MRVHKRWRRSPADAPSRQSRRRALIIRSRPEGGFSILETTMAVTIVFGVLMGLMASLNTGIRGLITGRQRSGALAVAKEVIEQARGVVYSDLGHDLSGDATLLTDPALTGAAPNFSYTPQGASAEPLVGAINPYFPAHEWDETRDGTLFSITAYVTHSEVQAGDDQKRLTIVVEFDPNQYAGSEVIKNKVVLSTFVSASGQTVPTETTAGVADADAGLITVTGSLEGVDLSSAEVVLPIAHADVTGKVLRRAHGAANSGNSTLTLNTGAVTGSCGSGLSATCSTVSAATAVDNDGGTPALIQDADGPEFGSSTTLGAGAFTLTSGGGTKSTSKGSVEACSTCSPAVSESDSDFWVENEAIGPSSAGLAFTAGPVSGTLLSLPGSGTVSNADIDSDPVTGGRLVQSDATADVAALELVTLDPLLDLPVGLGSIVEVGATHVYAATEAGPTATSPNAGGSPVAIRVWDEILPGVPGYSTVNVTPGVATSTVETVSFLATNLLTSEVATVTAETTITTTGKSTSCDPNCTSIESAWASLNNWLVITVHVTIETGGSTVADLEITADYGSVSAMSGYTP